MRRRTTDGPDTSMEGYHRNRKTRDPSFGSIRKERKNFTQEQKEILMDYIKSHLEDCYPGNGEKQVLAQRAGLSLSQVNDFMINARRRIVPLLRQERGLPPTNPRKRKVKTEDGRTSSTKRKIANSESEDSLSSGALSLSSGTSSARNDNDEVFEPDQPTSPLRSSASDQLKALNHSSYKSNSLCIRTEEYQRRDGGASSSSHSISSSPSPSSSLSPAHSDSDENHPNEERVVRQCDPIPIQNAVYHHHTAQELESAQILVGLIDLPAMSTVKNQ